MRLINTQTYKFKEVLGSTISKDYEYAILSHTWGEEEVTYGDYVRGNCKAMKGYEKIEMTCKYAREEGISWAWVDTCCIDKSSSAELSEAINSMFRWYQRAKICYVYLSDMPGDVDWIHRHSALSKCRWFKRGWTLQELIAPRHLVFFNDAWRLLGERIQGNVDSEMASELAIITGIEKAVLSGHRTLDTCCVAQKMSWAAHRETTRIEDMAYCLLGIFDLNMPLLYGEEEKAFRRLQEEIVRSKADLSILAWSFPENELVARSEGDADSSLCGLLAKSPAYFHASGRYEESQEGGLQEFSIASIGIRTRVRLQSISLSANPRAYALSIPVHCTSEGRRLGVRLRQVSRTQYLRQNPWALHIYDTTPGKEFPPTERFLLMDIPRSYGWANHGVASAQETMKNLRSYILRVESTDNVPLSDHWPSDRWDHEDDLFFVSRRPGRDFAFVKVTMRLLGLACEFRLITLGWSHTGAKALFSIVNDAAYGKVIGDIQDAASKHDLTSDVIYEALERNQIPQAHLAKSYLPELAHTAVVSVTANELEENNISRNGCYVVKISGEFRKGNWIPIREARHPTPQNQSG